MTSDALRDIFFEECEELLDSLMANLDLVSSGDWDKETVNAIFRAVHSIKGAAGAFGFNDLVAFAHHYETVLDDIRSDKLDIEGDVLRLVVRSADVLAELVDCSRIEGTPPPAAAEGITTELEELASNTDEAAADPSEEEAVFTPAPLDFAPLALPIELGDDYRIEFTPKSEIYLSGHEPQNLMLALSKVADCDISCPTDTVPLLGEFDFDESYLSWTVQARNAPSAAAIEDVFNFLDGLCTLKITEVSSQPDIDLPDLTEAVAPDDEADTEGETANPSGQLPDEAPDTPPAPPANTPRAAKPASSTGPKTVKTTLRVDPDRVDRLINSVGELIINHAVIDRNIQDSVLVSNSEMVAALDDYGNLAREIQEAVMAIRAQPVKSLFQRMGRVVREAGEATEKQVRYITDGENTEIDKTMLERLADPLTHMLRNAVDHGIEAPNDRNASEKPLEGTVRLSASHRSGHVVIEISDDGAGLNRDRILEKAIEKNIVAGDVNLTDSEVYALLFAPGFSTAENVTNLSGRGVGMDVVKTAISSLGGKVGISSVPGEGSTFSISLPLTLAVLDGMIVELGTEKMVLPLSNIVETVRPRKQDVQSVSPGELVLAIRGSFIPIINLSALLGFSDPQDCAFENHYVIIDTESATFAVGVTSIQDQRQVVIKSLKGNYGEVDGISAATILGDGNIALIVDPDALMELASQNKSAHARSELEFQK